MTKEHDIEEIEQNIELNEEEMAAEGLSPIPEEDAGFLPEVSEEELVAEEAVAADVELDGTELEGFESAEIEEVEFIEEERVESIIESILFASDRPVGLTALKLVFKGTNIKTDRIRKTLDQLAVEYVGGRRGVSLEEVPGGWQLRTKLDNMDFLRRTLKTRTFRLSGPALEVLSIVAYKQPMVKHHLDEIRGVESGHLLRALMEKGLVNFLGKSDLPGRPMQYGTTRRFLEIFGLRNLKELPTLSQIDELLPEGIGDEDQEKKQTLADVTSSLVAEGAALSSYSSGEDELQKIQDQLEQISTSSDFFEKEKIRQREQRDLEKAQNLRDAIAVGEEVSNRDLNWLRKYDEALAAGQTSAGIAAEAAAQESADEKRAAEVAAAEQLFDAEVDSEVDELPEMSAEIEEEGEGEGHASL